MIEQEYLELMHEEIDGEISPEQARRLFEYLRVNPEAADLFEELKSMSIELEGTRPVLVPPDFKEAVMKALAMDQDKVSGTAGAGTVLSIYRLRRYRPYLYTAAAGLLVGVFLASWYWSGSDQGLPSPALIRGTMVETEGQDTERLAGISIDGTGVRGSAEAFRTGRGIEFELTLEADESSTVVLECAPGGAKFHGLNSSDGDIEELSVEDTRVSFLHQGSRHYQLLFEPPISEVSFEVSILRDGKVVFSSTFGSGRGAR